MCFSVFCVFMLCFALCYEHSCIRAYRKLYMLLTPKSIQRPSVLLLKFIDGFNLQSPWMGRFCSTRLPHVIESSDSHLTVNFVSNADDIEAGGFRLNFTQVVRDTCGGYFLLTNRRPSVNTLSITSPNYPSSYEDNTICTWIITAPYNRRMSVQFLDSFEME